MKQYEYQAIEGGNNITIDELNEFGADSWKVCGIINGSILFVREVIQKEMSIAPDCEDLRVQVTEDQPDLSFLDVGSN